MMMMMMMSRVAMTIMKMIIMILSLLSMMMPYVYNELDNYDDMLAMAMHLLMMMRLSIKMMIFTCGLIDADCLHRT